MSQKSRTLAMATMGIVFSWSGYCHAQTFSVCTYDRHGHLVKVVRPDRSVVELGHIESVPLSKPLRLGREANKPLASTTARLPTQAVTAQRVAGCQAAVRVGPLPQSRPTAK